MNDIRSRSGKINDLRPLTAFLYELMRDHVVPGVVEKIVSQDQCAGIMEEYQFSNGWLASYAKDLSDRLERQTKEDAVLTWLKEQNVESTVERHFLYKLTDKRTLELEVKL